MHISRVEIKNFRLLAKVDLLLEERITIIVGRNNSGKTSFAELFRRLLSGQAANFRLEDFSLSSHKDFWAAFLSHLAGDEEGKVRQALPVIEVTLTIAYNKNAPALGLLSDFIIDLDPECTTAQIIFRYQLKDGEIGAFFADLDVNADAEEAKQRTDFFREIRERVPTHYTSCAWAIDPTDPANQKSVEFSTLRALVQGGFINAQRGLDDTTHKDINLLGKVLESLLASAMTDSADEEDRSIAEKLAVAVRDIQDGIDGGFNQQLQNLIPAFTLFGYPGLSDPRLITETTLDVQRLLTDHTRVHYAGVNGINLPEAYNGLGVRNLVFMLLKLYEFFKDFRAQAVAPAVQLIFIEEPEVHLHPQMQEVFVGQLGAIADIFASKFSNGARWPVQFVVTTHSSHVANKAPFDAMRYFLPTASADTARSTRIKDLRQGLGGTPKEDREFLHKYMTLTRCDLLFADKAILIEGTTERLLLPSMIEKIDAGGPQSLHLSSQYVSVVEVGGAYAHIFFCLLEFLELRTLIITDLDSVKDNGSGRLIACKVSEGTGTSNACIKKWFDETDSAPTVLLQKSEEDKLKGIRRIAYQVPEANGDPCGRSFEDAFVLANAVMFSLVGSPSERETSAWDTAACVAKKSDFALKYAIKESAWAVPRYIAEGLRWLATGGAPAAQVPAPAAPPPTPAKSENANA